MEGKVEQVLSAIEFCSSDAVLQLMGVQAVFHGLSPEIRNAAEAFLRDLRRSHPRLRADASLAADAVIAGLMGEMERRGIPTEDRVRLRQWIVLCWILSERLDGIRTCMRDKFRQLDRQSGEPLASEAGTIAAQACRMFLQKPRMEELEWEDVGKVVSLNEWDWVIAADLGWSRDEFLFYISGKFVQVSESRHFAKYLRRLTEDFGPEGVVELIQLWCGNEAGGVVLEICRSPYP